MKVLVFTSSYKRPHMLRQCILNAKNQTYKKFKHGINITSDKDDLQNYVKLIDDVYVPDKMGLIHSINSHTHFNNMAAIKQFRNYDTYDVFIKMDDDDVYKAPYVENIVNMFESDSTIDIVSSQIRYQLNGYKLNEGEEPYDNLGGNPGNSDYHMPMTFAFNKRAFDVIKDLEQKDVFGYDDMMWRMHWEAHGLKHSTVDNTEEIIWHIHGKNVSTANF
jgi:hypothetical protein